MVYVFWCVDEAPKNRFSQYHPLSKKEYKHLTGEDVRLQQSVIDTPAGQRFYGWFDNWIDEHASRAHLKGISVIQLFIGCKSGQHRSVAFACRCATLREPCHETVITSHRDRTHWITTVEVVRERAVAERAETMLVRYAREP